MAVVGSVILAVLAISMYDILIFPLSSGKKPSTLEWCGAILIWIATVQMLTLGFYSIISH